MNPIEALKRLEALQRDAPLDLNLEILFSGQRIGELDFLALYRECLAATATPVYGWKVFRRAQRALNLARYFDHSLGVPGERVECGVFRGFSALLIARVARMRSPAFSGEGLHLVDSFEGLSRPTLQDAVATDQGPMATHAAGHFAVALGQVRAALAAFPRTGLHKGWIPEVLARLPDRRWSFVHIDVDLYEPTLACLEYFVPRLAPGGIVVNDDYASPLFPGGGTAWNDYCVARRLPSVILDSGQSVLIRTW